MTTGQKYLSKKAPNPIRTGGRSILFIIASSDPDAFREKRRLLTAKLEQVVGVWGIGGYTLGEQDQKAS